MTCTHCGTEIAAKALICYRCGKATTEPKVKPPEMTSVFERPRRFPLVIVVIAVAIAALAAAWALGLLSPAP